MKKKIIGFLGIIIYRILLDINYVTIISPIYDYTGFDNLMTVDSFLLSWFVLLLSIPSIVRFYCSRRLFCANVIVLLYLICFVPGTSLMAFMPMTPCFFILYVVYWFLLLLGGRFLKPVKIFKLPPNEGRFLLYFTLIVLTLGVLYASWRYTGFRMNFDLMNVYDLRDEERSWNMPIGLAYLLPAADNLLPVLLVYFLFSKHRNLALLVGVIIFLNFSIGGHKSVIFKLFICFLGYWFYNENRISFYAWALAVVSLFSIFEFKVGGSFFICSFIINRTLYLPAFLNYNYYDFFSTHELDFFRQSFLRHFGFESPYDIPITKLIGGEYYDNFESTANNGLFSDAYSNLGVAGILVFPLVLAFLLNLMDSISRGISVKLLILPIIAVALTFAGATLMSALLTNGILLIMLVLFAFPKDKTNIL